MKVLLKPGALEEMQSELELTDQDFSEYIGVSRSQLWRAKMPPNDKRFSLGNDFVAAVLNRFREKTFEDFFFLGNPSHECDKKEGVI